MLIKPDVSNILTGSTTNADARSVCGSWPSCFLILFNLAVLFDRYFLKAARVKSRVTFVCLFVII